jgi:signal transduction histidine kinase
LEYEDKFLNFTIEDDGVGFNISDDTLSKQKGTGVGNMVHRARLIGAKMEIDSVKGRGTIIQLTVPID